MNFFRRRGEISVTGEIVENPADAFERAMELRRNPQNDSFEVAVPLHRATQIVYSGEQCVVMPIGHGQDGNNVRYSSRGGYELISQTSRQGLARVLIDDSNRKGISLGASGGDQSRHPVRNGALLFVGGAALALIANNFLHVPGGTASSADVPSAVAPKAGESTDGAGPTADADPTVQPAPSATETSSPTPVRDLVGYTVVLDPGHSGGNTVSTKDVETGLMDERYSNEPEMTDVYNIAKQVEAGLKARGVKVFLTKDSAQAKMNNRQRADFAMKHKATVAASIHYDASQNESNFSVVWDQRLGEYRQNVDKKGNAVGSKREFENPTLACLSQGDAKAMAETRTEVQGAETIVAKANFNNRGYPKPKGNIPLVMLFQGTGHNSGAEDNNPSKGVPWIYNEVGAKGFTQDDLDRYGDALLKGLVKILETQKQIKKDCGIIE